MKISKTLITRLETLSHIELSSDSRDKITPQLQAIIAYINQLNKLDTSCVQPAHLGTSDETLAMREDKTQGGLSRQDAFGQAPGISGEFFRVPGVIEVEVDK